MTVVLGERMAQRLVALGAPSQSLRIISNFADGDLVTPQSHTANNLRAAWGLADFFVVAYSGNLGRAHEYGTLLDAMARLEGQTANGRSRLGQPTAVPMRGKAVLRLSGFSSAAGRPTRN